MTENTYKKKLIVEDFLSESRLRVSDFICSLCHGVLFQPVADFCGHLFCQDCLETYLSTNQTCPITHNPLNIDQPIEVPSIRKFIDKMSIKCKNSNEGCNWKGELRNLQYHIDTICKKQKVKCQNSQCKLMIKREDLKEHLKKCGFKEEQCPDCGIMLLREQIEYHKRKCPKLKIPCIQECKQLIPRDEMTIHIEKECNNTKIECPFSLLSCKAIITRKTLEQHMKDSKNEHLLMVINGVIDIKTDIHSKIDELVENKSQVIKEKFIEMLNEQCRELSIMRNIKEEPLEIVQVESLTLERKVDNNESSEEVIDINNDSDNSFLNKKIKRNQNDILPYIKQEIKKDFYDYDNDDSSNSNNNIHNSNYFQFDIIPEDIVINDCYVRCKTTSQAPKFVFCNYTISKKRKKNIFTFTIYPSSLWIGLGLCDKDLLKENNMQLSSHIDNGLFIISTSGYTWNSNVPQENEIKIPKFIPKKIEEDITFEYIYETKILQYSFGNRFKGCLTNVFPKRSKRLTACIVFLNENDEVKFSFICI